MTSAEVMKEMRDELSNANQQAGIILECLALQRKIFDTKDVDPEQAVWHFTSEQKEMLNELYLHMQSACKRM